jgi:hypothetical protein
MMRADVIKNYTDQNRRCCLHFSTVTGFLI